MAAVVPAAGSGTRLARGMPKAFVEVAGEPMLVRAVRGLLASGVVDDVVVAVPGELESLADELLAPLAGRGHEVRTCTGGAERTDSVRRGLEALGGSESYDVVLVHDAARCLTPPAAVERVVDAVRSGQSAVVPVLPVVDTVKQVDSDGIVVATPDRGALRIVQTPQGFDPRTLLAAYAAAGDIATDDAGLVERLGQPVATVAGDAESFKITTEDDLLRAEHHLSLAATPADPAAPGTPDIPSPTSEES